VDNTVLLDIILIFHSLILLINNNKLNKNTPQLTSKKTLPSVLGARCVYATLAWSLAWPNARTYQLFLQTGGIASNGSQAQGAQFGVLADDPLGQFAERQQQGVPVLRIGLQAIPEGKQGKTAVRFRSKLGNKYQNMYTLKKKSEYNQTRLKKYIKDKENYL